ncbi:hypothetical protein [Cellulomonas chengniuliangii]|uniref:Uncharacterized protein n=1 Tax=Cellulomonas chengniuliangii TaxID=2968084 RepID=A0ABY5KXP3_9CELL|nr:hypothetical protein [Cellulomonas chengniuliangii]MCC2307979.1 hypothetical protein [Cellulomonas chengniuliangii]UUI75272.1 hypothetical protein NP064_16165 [Cellulomonas chengniuliangii]
MSESGLGQFLDAIDKLPAFNGIAFRGLAAGEVEPPPLGVVTGVLAASRDARVASENFTAGRLLVLLNRTGRDVSMFAERPADAEIVVRPGSVWHRLTEFETPGIAAPLLVLEELDVADVTASPTEWGDTLAELTARVTRAVQQSLAAAPNEIGSPGKFVGPWPAQVAERR